MRSRSRSSRTKPSQRSSDAAAADPARAITAILCATVAIMPLALVTGIFISHDVIPKVVVLTTGTALLFFLFPRWAPALQSFWRLPGGRAYLLLVLAQFASLLVSTLFSSQIPLSLGGTVWRRFGLIGQTATLIVAVAVACMAASRPAASRFEWIRTLFRAVAVCGGLASIYGILQYFNLDPFLDRRLYAIEYFGGIARPPSTMGHALYFSAYLVPVLFIATASAFAETSRVWRRMHAFAAVLAASAIVLSATRSAMAAAVVGGVFFGWRAIHRQPANGSSWNFTLRYVAVRLGVLLAVSLAVSAFILSPAGLNLRNRMLQWRDDPGGPRLQMWKECPGLIARHPFLGGGPETFAGEFRKIQSVQLSRAYPDFYNETPHNALLDAACAQGIPGALILASVFLLTWRAGRNDNLTPTLLRSGLDAAMLGILISSMFASLTLVTSLYLWTIAGLAAALNPGAPVAGHRREWHIPRFIERAAPIMLGTAYLGLGAMYLVLGATLALQDAAWSDMGTAVDNGNFPMAREAYSRATSVALGMPGYELRGSREWALLGRSLAKSPADTAASSSDAAAAWEMAASAAALAEAAGEERFSAAYQSSVLAVAGGELIRAESEARAAIRLAPNWYKGHLLLSQILQYMGRTDDADREAALSASMGWRKQP